MPDETATPAASQSQRAGDPVGVSLMITKAQRADLRARGFTAEAIGEMTPAQAHAILRPSCGAASDAAAEPAPLPAAGLPDPPEA